MRPAAIETYQREVWHGGAVWVEPEYPNLLFAEDGQLFQLGDRKAFVIGGAYSVDKFYRLIQNPWEPKWWPDEQPSAEVKAAVEANLEKIGWNVDILLTHTCPFNYMPTESFLPGIDQDRVDHSTEQWLGNLEQRMSYNAWYCGHWHIDKRIDRIHFLFNSTEEITETEER
jgi:3-oxoacid CoA-transferase subunit A